MRRVIRPGRPVSPDRAQAIHWSRVYPIPPLWPEGKPRPEPMVKTTSDEAFAKRMAELGRAVPLHVWEKLTLEARAMCSPAPEAAPAIPVKPKRKRRAGWKWRRRAPEVKEAQPPVVRLPEPPRVEMLDGEYPEPEFD